ARTWFERTRKKILPSAPGLYNDETPGSVSRFKKHPLLLSLCRMLVERQQADFARELESGLGDASTGATVVARWRKLEGQPLVPRVHALRTWLLNEAHELPPATRQRADNVLRRLSRRAKDVLTDWSELLTDRRLLESAVAERAAGAFTARELDEVCAWCARQVEEVPAKEEEEHERDKERDEEAPESGEERDDHTPYLSVDGHDEREVEGAGRLDRPDDSLLVYLHLLKHGGLKPPTGPAISYEHVVVDEAQDLSAVELKVLVEAAGRGRCVTLAGDTAQRLVFDNAFSSWEALLEELGIPATTSATLRLGYRSTGEVMALARSLLGSVAPEGEPAAVRSGAPVELHRFASQGEAVAMLSEALRSLALREPLASVALIARYPAQAISYAQSLTQAEVPAVRLVRHQDFSFKAGIEVTDVAQVKGLEFDYVLLLDVTARNFPDSLESRHLLHIAATRAAHQLWLVSVGDPSPLLPATL
ncbi:MAG: ATP-binding domain-containing protein, partial [Deltaproteobacteria bacterium]|nr:ATP-binding domain-containing protein [Deltaproteobacteria bacterium]